MKAILLLTLLTAILGWTHASGKQPTCGCNEVFNKNKKSCPPETCRSILIKVLCVADQKSEPGCQCKRGYLRDRNNRCIPREQCPEAQQCPINEAYDLCGSYCPKTCRNRFMPPTPCIAGCKEGCNCLPGFYRHDNETCVAPEDCSPPECIQNAHYENCTGPCELTCDNYGTTKDPSCADPCIPACVCDEGYIKKSQYECVKYEDCPKPICTGINEVASKCSFVCPPQDCDSPYKEYDCSAEAGKCRPGCNCIKDHLRNATGHCIPSDQCPQSNQCGGANEVWSECNGHCQKTCAQKDIEIGCPAVCQSGCICKPGYLKDDDGNCIPEDKCQLCPVNERWVPCRLGMCSAKSCDDLGNPIACADIIGPCNDEGCVCIEGYLRNYEGICVPVDQCPKCGKDFNATAGCSNYCGNSCADYQDKDIKCTEICQYNGCSCRKGYVYNEALEMCVEPQDCPKHAKKCEDSNAERVTCATHCPATCAKPEPDPCPYAACTKNGCQCKSGYVLSEIGGKCIKISECPADAACNGDENAQIKQCPNPCPATCNNPEVKDCRIPCYDVGCECRPGYIKEKIPFGKCIKPEDCGASCGANERYLTNTNECQRSCYDLKPNAPPSQCPPSSGCFCNPGYVRQERNGRGPCVLKETCHASSCGANERYLTNTNECQRSCYDLNPNAPPSQCPPSSGCFCNPDYVRLERNGRGPCVPKERCPPRT